MGDVLVDIQRLGRTCLSPRSKAGEVGGGENANTKIAGILG